MPPIQEVYNATHARWVEGMVLNSEPCVVVSRIVEGADGLGFGKVAVQGTGDKQVRDSEAGRLYVGIAVLDVTQDFDTYAEFATAAIMKKGVIVVQASVAVEVGGPVYFVPATGVFTDVATDNTLIPNAQWETSTTAAGLAAVRLN